MSDFMEHDISKTIAKSSNGLIEQSAVEDNTSCPTKSGNTRIGSCRWIERTQITLTDHRTLIVTRLDEFVSRLLGVDLKDLSNDLFFFFGNQVGVRISRGICTESCREVVSPLRNFTRCHRLCTVCADVLLTLNLPVSRVIARTCPRRQRNRLWFDLGRNLDYCTAQLPQICRSIDGRICIGP